jgi:solute carrier family 25 citrate transporter 1
MSNFVQGTRLLVHEQGFSGLYKGLLPTTVKQSATSAVRMGSYNVLKQAFQNHNIPINGATTFGLGATAGVITVYTTQPFDTVKTRVQSAAGSSMADALRTILRERGIRGFWNGSTMRLGRLVFSGGIVFSVYEHVAALLGTAKMGA